MADYSKQQNEVYLGYDISSFYWVEKYCYSTKHFTGEEVSQGTNRSLVGIMFALKKVALKIKLQARHFHSTETHMDLYLFRRLPQLKSSITFKSRIVENKNFVRLKLVTKT